MCMDEFVLPGTGRGHGEFDSPDTNPDQGADFQQLQPDGGAGGMRELGVGKADAAQRAEQHVGHRGGLASEKWRVLCYERGPR